MKQWIGVSLMLCGVAAWCASVYGLHSGAPAAKPLTSIVHGYPCNIERIAPPASTEEFVAQYRHRTVIIQGASDNTEFRALSQLPRLKQLYGDRVVTLSHATTYSSSQRTVTIRDYIDTMMRPVTLADLSNETFYFFGDYPRAEWDDLLQHYQLPPFLWEGAMLSFGMGGDQSGVPFHYHGAGFSEVLHGRKRWFVMPHGEKPVFDPDRSSLQWLHEVYPTLTPEQRPLECVIEPGEVLYFPPSWYHATLNLGDAVFVSTFIDDMRHPSPPSPASPQPPPAPSSSATPSPAVAAAAAAAAAVRTIRPLSAFTDADTRADEL